MFGWLGKKEQVKIEAVDENGSKTTFWQDLVPEGESQIHEADAVLKKTGKRYPSITVFFPK